MGQNKRDKLTEFNRNNILDVAKKLFEKNGIMATTMDEIAKEAEYSKSTIYVYFRSKDEIYYSLIYESMVSLKERLKPVTEHNDFEKAYFSICRILVDFKQEHPLYFDGITGEISVDERDFATCPVLRDIYNAGEETNEIMAAAVRRGMDSGYLRDDLRPVPAILTLWASLCGIIKMAELKEKYFREKLNISKQEYLNYSFRMLLRTLKAGE